MKLAELRAERAKKVKAASELDATMSAPGYVEKAEDNTAYDAIIAEIDALDGKIKRAVKMEQLKGETADVLTPDAGVDLTEGIVSFPKMARYGKLKHFSGATAEKDAYTSGMFLRATIFDDRTAADWCKNNGLVANMKAQAEGTNTAGGFLVPTQFETAIIDLREAYGTFRRLCKLVPMGSDSMTIPRRAGGLQAFFVGEGKQITESQKAWNQVALAAKKLAALALMSTELAEDAVISIADDLAGEFAYAFAQKEDDCGWNGDGTSTYGGITGVRTKFAAGSTVYKGAVDAAAGHQTFASIDANDLAGLMALLPKYAEARAKWYCSQFAWATVFQRLIAAAGGVTMGELTGGKPQKSYLGYDVEIDQSLPSTSGNQPGAAMILFGDLAMSTLMGERRGIRVKTSEERYFEYDQVGMMATQRFDMNVHDLGDATTAGPLLALMGKA